MERGWAVACKYCFRPCPRDISNGGTKGKQRTRNCTRATPRMTVKVGFRATEVVAKYDPKRRGKCGNMIYTAGGTSAQIAPGGWEILIGSWWERKREAPLSQERKPRWRYIQDVETRKDVNVWPYAYINTKISLACYRESFLAADYCRFKSIEGFKSRYVSHARA